MKKIIALITILLSFSLTSCGITKNVITIDKIYNENNQNYTIDWSQAYEKARKSTCFIYDMLNSKERSGLCVAKDGNTYYIVTTAEFHRKLTLSVYYENELLANANEITINHDQSNNLSLLSFTTTKDIELIPVTYSNLEVEKGIPAMVLTNNVIAVSDNEQIFVPYMNKGIISYVSDNAISTDAPTNSLSLGAGIFDQNGDLLGIINQEETKTSSTTTDYYQGICYGIRSEELQIIVNQLKVSDVKRVSLGVTVTMVDQNVLNDSNINISLPDDGIYCRVVEVAYPSNAYTAGIKSNDIIFEINGDKVTSLDTISKHLMTSIPTTTLNFKVGRMENGMLNYYDLSVKLSQY